MSRARERLQRARRAAAANATYDSLVHREMIDAEAKRRGWDIADFDQTVREQFQAWVDAGRPEHH